MEQFWSILKAWNPWCQGMFMLGTIAIVAIVIKAFLSHLVLVIHGYESQHQPPAPQELPEIPIEIRTLIEYRLGIQAILEACASTCDECNEDHLKIDPTPLVHEYATAFKKCGLHDEAYLLYGAGGGGGSVGNAAYNHQTEGLS